MSTIDAFVAMLHPLQIPRTPTQLPTIDQNYVNPNTIHAPSAADPTLNLVIQDQIASLYTVSITIDHPNPVGNTGLVESILALTYDPKRLSVSPADITLGSLLANSTGWTLSSVIDQTTGQIGLELFSQTPITANLAGSLANICFHSTSGQELSASAVQLISAVSPNGRTFATEVADTLGTMILSAGVDQVQISMGMNYDPNFDTTPANRDLASPLSLLLDSNSKNDNRQVNPRSLSAGKLSSQAQITVLDEGMEVPFLTPIGDPVPQVISDTQSLTASHVIQIGSSTIPNAPLFQNGPLQLTVFCLFGTQNCGLDFLSNSNLEITNLDSIWNRQMYPTDDSSILGQLEAFDSISHSRADSLCRVEWVNNDVLETVFTEFLNDPDDFGQ